VGKIHKLIRMYRFTMAIRKLGFMQFVLLSIIVLKIRKK